MTSPNFNYFYRVDITVARYDDDPVNPDTKTYSFVNKPLRDAGTSTSTYWPILKSIGEVTLAAGEFLPSVSVSSITIDNMRGSFGADRRFGDVLERYSATNQTMTMYIGESDVNSDTVTSGWTQIVTAKIQSYTTSLNSDSQELTFNIAPFKVSEKPMTFEITRGDLPTVNLVMKDAPDSAVGKHVPLVFASAPSGDVGAQEVQCIRYSRDGRIPAEFAITSSIAGNIGAKLYVINVKKSWDVGVYQGIANSQYVSFTNTTDSGSLNEIPAVITPTVSGSYISLNSYASIAFPLIAPSVPVIGPGVLSGIRLRAHPNGTSYSSNASLTVAILRVDKTNNSVVETMATGRALLGTYNTQNNGASDFNINIAFDRTIVITGADIEYSFYIEIKGTGVTASDLSLCKWNDGVGGAANSSQTVLLQETTAASGSTYDSRSERKIATLGTTTTYPLAYEFIGPSYNFNNGNDINALGLSWSFLRLSIGSFDSGQTRPSFDQLEIVCEVSGTFDTYTNTEIYAPHEICKAMSLEYIPSDPLSESFGDYYDTGIFDSTTLQTSHYDKVFKANSSHRARFLAGIINGPVTFSQVLSEVCRGTASRVGIFSSGALFLYPWGVTVEPAFNIPYGDIIPLSWETRDDSTIINLANINAIRSFTGTVNNGERGDGYKVSLDYFGGTNDRVNKLRRKSVIEFNNKPLENSNFDVVGLAGPTDEGTYGVVGYLQDVSPSADFYSSDFLVEYYLARFAKPLTYCSFVIPWHRYKAIRMFDVITFSHPDFPAFYGTDPEARIVPVNDGTDVVGADKLTGGHELIRAQTYRGLVEAVSYVMAMEHAPAIRVTVQVLTNRELDPT